MNVCFFVNKLGQCSKKGTCSTVPYFLSYVLHMLNCVKFTVQGPVPRSSLGLPRMCFIWTHYPNISDQDKWSMESGYQLIKLTQHFTRTFTLKGWCSQHLTNHKGGFTDHMTFLPEKMILMSAIYSRDVIKWWYFLKLLIMSACLYLNKHKSIAVKSSTVVKSTK